MIPNTSSSIHSSSLESEQQQHCVEHIVFFIHGMGQQYEKFGNMKHHVSTIQKNTNELISSHYPEENLRVRYYPIEWHSDIHEIVDAKMNKSTLTTVPKVRLATNHWLMDCLYYFSKPHGQYIIDSVCKQLNTTYNQHLIEFPDFSGHVHIIGFSLGGIIAYDVASMQWFDSDGMPPWQQAVLDTMACQTPDIIVPRLDFKIRNIFTCGSPIAAGLVCRGLDYMHYRPPLRTKIYNVFHPFDPLGYRLEPMINTEYDTITPVQILRLKRLPKIPNLGIRSSIAGAKPLLRSFWQYIRSSGSSSSTTTTISSSTNNSQIETPSAEELEEEIVEEILIGMKRGNNEMEEDVMVKRRKLSGSSSPSLTSSAEESEEEEADVFVSRTITPPPIEGKDGQLYPRLDYVLTENIIDSYASEWIVALKSHFRYWANRDLTFHMIKVFSDDRP